MKMSDVFEGLVCTRYLDKEALGELANGEDSGNSFNLEDDRYWLATTKKHMDYAAHAINHHDELVEALEGLISAINNPNPDAHEHVNYAENVAKAILNKAKGLDE